MYKYSITHCTIYVLLYITLHNIDMVMVHQEVRWKRYSHQLLPSQDENSDILISILKKILPRPENQWLKMSHIFLGLGVYLSWGMLLWRTTQHSQTTPLVGQRSQCRNTSYTVWPYPLEWLSQDSWQGKHLSKLKYHAANMIPHILQVFSNNSQLSVD